MTYKLIFNPAAHKEWLKLDKSVRDKFAKKLRERLENPHVASARLRGTLRKCYKIKITNPQFRLVYWVRDQELIVVVISVGSRDNDKAYENAGARVDEHRDEEIVEEQFP